MGDGSRVAPSLGAAVAGPHRHKMWAPESYAGLDAGIRFAVKVLHAQGIDTGQSCEGGEGHSYDRPSIDIDEGITAGFAAFHALMQYGLAVHSLAWHYPIHDGVPAGPFWRIELGRPYPDRADEWPLFVWHYQAPPTSSGEQE